MEKVRVGIVGSRFIAHLHLEYYRKIRGHKMEVVGVTAKNEESARKFAKEFDIPHVYRNYREMLEQKEIDAIDLCLPTNLHKEVAIAGAEMGKHIICEKPLTGYFGEDRQEELVGDTVSREVMFKTAMEGCRQVRNAVEKNNVKFCYAEDWVYSPPIEKFKRIIRATGGTVMEMRAEEGHSGSHAEYSRKWKTSGGGALMRLGAHPIGAVIHLKHFEGKFRNGRPIRVKSVTGEVGRHTKIESFQKEPKKWLVTNWVDVEDWSTLIIEFEDLTKAIIFASDGILGGCRNTLQAFMSNAVVFANIYPSDTMRVYAPDASIMGDEYLVEKLETKAGWNFPFPEEGWIRGFPQELEDFIDAIREDREPLSDLTLAEEVVEVIYAGYLSAERGQRIQLER